MTKKIRSGLVKRIHVDQRRIRENRKTGSDLPVFTIQTSSGPIKARRVQIDGPSELIHSEKPLGCGARVWIFSTSQVNYDE